VSLYAERLIDGRYRLNCLIGGGGERHTWMGFDEETGQSVTLKVLLFDKVASADLKLQAKKLSD
jgi:hypothetical protein